MTGHLDVMLVPKIAGVLIIVLILCPVQFGF
jgi:hypothetical protein